MKMQLVSIRDRAADVFGVPTFVHSLGAAIRSFGDEINKKDGNPLSGHPEDFDLYHVGEYDDNNGLVYSHEPRQIAVGKDLVRS